MGPTAGDISCGTRYTMFMNMRIRNKVGPTNKKISPNASMQERV